MASSRVRESSQKRKKDNSREETLEDLVEQMQVFLDENLRKRKRQSMNFIAILVRGFKSTITSIAHDRNRRIPTAPSRTNPQHQVLKVIKFKFQFSHAWD